MATPVAVREGAIAAENALAAAGRRMDYQEIPRAVFTDPEIGVVGLTGEEAEAQGIECACRVLDLRFIPKARAIQEMRHAERLIERVLFLEGKPIVSKLNPIQIGEQVPEIHKNDLEAEYEAARVYNKTIKLAAELGDAATKVMLEEILKDEEAHIDWLESQLDQIQQMGLENYLAQQVG